MSMGPVRDQLVLAALPHVPFDGWSWRSLQTAAVNEGLAPSMAERAFPDGPVGAVEHFSALADRQVREEARAADLSAIGMTGRVAWLVRRRIEAWEDHKEAVRRAGTLLCLPQHAPVALRMAWRTADALWDAAGIHSTDFSYYTRRASLAAVVATTGLFWLDDTSIGSEETWRFLERRLANILLLPKIGASVRRQVGDLVKPFDVWMRQSAR
jgi:ubiquinone biosynthesis protein COQ9